MLTHLSRASLSFGKDANYPEAWGRGAGPERKHWDHSCNSTAQDAGALGGLVAPNWLSGVSMKSTEPFHWASWNLGAVLWSLLQNQDKQLPAASDFLPPPPFHSPPPTPAHPRLLLQRLACLASLSWLPSSSRCPVPGPSPAGDSPSGCEFSEETIFVVLCLPAAPQTSWKLHT